MEPRTRQQPRPEPLPQRSGDLDATTLAIAAVASAAAAFVTSQVWAGGTLWSAAMTPVIVALVREVLRRPVERVRTVRTTRGGRTVEVPVEEMADPDRPDEPVAVYRRSGESRWSSRRVRIAIITGLLAFAGVAVAYTVPELLAGRSLGGGGDNRTTLFGGQPRKATEKKKAEPTATPQATAAPGTTATPEAAETPEATATPAETPTPEATETPAPPPAAETPAPTP
jgi:hypothetical protein